MSQKIRVLIADDEALGRREMRRLLKAHADLEIVAEAEDGDQAVELIEKHSPDLIFLDIRMPGRDGFGVLDALEPPLPEIVFSTAYDQFAVDAIRRGALDYLLKPVAPEELARAMEKARERIGAKGPKLRRDGVLRGSDRIFVKDGKKVMFLEVEKISILESQGNYTKIVSSLGHILMHKPIGYFQDRLDPDLFLRANRSIMLNLARVSLWEPIHGGRFKATLEGGASFEVSRRQSRALQRKLKL